LHRYLELVSTLQVLVTQRKKMESEMLLEAQFELE